MKGWFIGVEEGEKGRREKIRGERRAKWQEQREEGGARRASSICRIQPAVENKLDGVKIDRR
eukprot:761430-Hanusia_phi.AAC.3